MKPYRKLKIAAPTKETRCGSRHSLQAVRQGVHDRDAQPYQAPPARMGPPHDLPRMQA